MSTLQSQTPLFVEPVLGQVAMPKAAAAAMLVAFHDNLSKVNKVK